MTGLIFFLSLPSGGVGMYERGQIELTRNWIIKYCVPGLDSNCWCTIRFFSNFVRGSEAEALSGSIVDGADGPSYG